MNNPFESGHIKNYVFAYVSVVAIMILFFIASTLFLDEKSVDKKEFKENARESLKDIREKNRVAEDVNTTRKYKLLDKAY